MVDDFLLKDAYAKRKPVLGICYGLQILNVYRGGTLLQHIESPVNHEAGKSVPVAHTVKVDRDSRLSAIVGGGTTVASEKSASTIPVNSSHHQAAQAVGEGLRVVAHCAEDGVVEALEGIDPNHFVIAVQWHPERSVEDDESSRAIFRALVDEAKARHARLAGNRTVRQV